ncbi:energy-coupling factor transporter transmembrane component T family protein [Flexistipes sinusarabici]|uniref:energy-coupling factor transporter transmembrane component T family protein n=1 Tax=Flexistipes sinusarabici TaxID=2352 RepID=UPI0023577E59|nr:energy-coupling factor transporter transmembrane component T [Flexistipes sinusarabici]
MKTAQDRLQHLTAFEELAESDFPLNIVSPAVKIIVAAVFIILTISVNKYDVIHSLLLTSFTCFLIAIAPLKVTSVLKMLLYLSPFVLLLVIFNPVYDKSVITIAGYQVYGGYVSAFTTVLKFINTTTVSVLIVSSTKFNHIASSLRFFRVPKFLVIQFMVMYRFIFIFLYDIIQSLQAVNSRGLQSAGFSWRNMKAIISAFFVKSVLRGEEVYNAMLSRGFEIKNFKFDNKINVGDIFFGFCSLLYVFIVRFV